MPETKLFSQISEALSASKEDYQDLSARIEFERAEYEAELESAQEEIRGKEENLKVIFLLFRLCALSDYQGSQTELRNRIFVLKLGEIMRLLSTRLNLKCWPRYSMYSCVPRTWVWTGRLLIEHTCWVCCILPASYFQLVKHCSNGLRWSTEVILPFALVVKACSYTSSFWLKSGSLF